MELEKEKKRKRRFILVVALIAILLVTVFLFWYAHQTGTGREKYPFYVEVKDEVCTVTVNGTFPSKLDIYIDSRAEPQVNYTVWAEKNVTFYVAQEIESIPKINCTEIESSILYSIRLENCSFYWAMITFLDAHTGEYLLTIEIEEPFVSFFMQFETYKRISE